MTSEPTTDTRHSQVRRPTVALATLGCKLNQSETEQIARVFASEGFAVADFGSPFDVFVVNTCTVTHVADRKSRQLIRQARRHNPDALVVVTGCYADVSAEEIHGMDAVDLIVPNARKSELVQEVRRHLGIQEFTLSTSNPGTQRTRAFVKIQDGCNQFCTYCIVPFARGRERSEPVHAVIDAVNKSSAFGFKEIVLTGVHIGTYGRDLPGEQKTDLAGLVDGILQRTHIPRLRLSSVEPQDMAEGILDLWPSPRLCRHLHLPLQSGCDTVLRRMLRPYSADRFRRIVDQARSRIPGLAVTTDVIVGFPGETDEEFKRTFDFVEEMGLAGIHVFKYSARKGTAAARLPEQVPYEAKKERSEALIRLGRDGARRFASAFLGRGLDVLYECQVADLDGEGSKWEGLTDNYLRVVCQHHGDLVNQILPTKILRHSETGLVGEMQFRPGAQS